MSDNTKLQANFKLADGTLINVYADNLQEFDMYLSGVLGAVGQIHSVSAALGNFTRSNVNDLIATQLGGQVVSSAPVTREEPPSVSALIYSVGTFILTAM